MGADTGFSSMVNFVWACHLATGRVDPLLNSLLSAVSSHRVFLAKPVASEWRIFPC